MTCTKAISTVGTVHVCAGTVFLFDGRTVTVALLYDMMHAVQAHTCLFAHPFLLPSVMRFFKMRKGHGDIPGNQQEERRTVFYMAQTFVVGMFAGKFLHPPCCPHSFQVESSVFCVYF